MVPFLCALQLARYLNRSYWEDKRDGRGPATAAPPSSSESSGPVYNKHGVPVGFFLSFVHNQFVLLLNYDLCQPEILA